MSDTVREAVARTLAIAATLDDIRAVRLLGIAEGMAMSGDNLARDKPDHKAA